MIIGGNDDRVLPSALLQPVPELEPDPASVPEPELEPELEPQPGPSRSQPQPMNLIEGEFPEPPSLNEPPLNEIPGNEFRFLRITEYARNGDDSIVVYEGVLLEGLNDQIGDYEPLL